MIGKAVKLAEGFLDTHSKKVVMNKDFLKDLAHQAGCAEDTIQKIDAITLARELWQLLPAEQQETFFNLLLKRCHEHCTPLLPKGELSILLITEEGVIWK